MRFQPLPISGHCEVVPFLVTKLCSPGKSVLRYLCQCQRAQVPLWCSQAPPACAQLRQQLGMDTGAAGKCVPSVQSSQKSSVHLFSLSMVVPVKQECCIQENPPFPWIAAAP